MKWSSLCLVVLIFGCGSQDAVDDKPPDRTVAAAFDAEQVAAAAAATLQDILVDLHGLKSDFPQLADIDSTPLRATGFTYSKGLQSAIKVPNPTFDENGCYISVEIVDYQPDDNERMKEFALSQRAWDHYEVKGGTRYAVWTFVGAESNELGNRFTDRVALLIADHLKALQTKVNAQPIEFNPADPPPAPTDK
jgi:hypothetical protein